MSRIYDTALFYGVKLKARAANREAVNALWDGRDKLTAGAVEASLEIYCREMTGYFHYEKDEVIVFVGKWIARADLDHPFAEFDRGEVAGSALDAVVAKLQSAGYKDAPKFHLVCSHSD